MQPIRIALQENDFDLTFEYNALRKAHPNAGAVCTFTGLVRDLSKQGSTVSGIELSTYPSMAEAQMQQLAKTAFERFDVCGITIIHRYGVLTPNEQIVFVGVASLHRGESFSAAEMIMDHLKAKVAFWKKEHFTDTSSEAHAAQWIQVRPDDLKALERWNETT